MTNTTTVGASATADADGASADGDEAGLVAADTHTTDICRRLALASNVRVITTVYGDAAGCMSAEHAHGYAGDVVGATTCCGAGQQCHGMRWVCMSACDLHLINSVCW